MTSSLSQQIQDRLEEFLISKSLRRTRQRDVIVEAAFSTTDHFTADELWEKARKIDATASRATLYRTLGLLVESGLLKEIDLGRDQTYYDPNFVDHPHHNHLICTDCQKVVEFEDTHMSLLEDCITRRLGFRPETSSVRIEASCDELRRMGDCQRRKK
ncbi:MAG: transcriptional repressor [Verrucomicrobiaceae bacterium]|nr:MAG: transcriptional repressor [Verrucomicrobiaceae bacterium]